MVDGVKDKQQTGDVLTFPAKEEYTPFNLHRQKTQGFYLTLSLKDGRSMALRYKLFEEIDVDKHGNTILIRLLNGHSVKLSGHHLGDLVDLLQQHAVARIFEYNPAQCKEPQGNTPVIRLISRE